MAILHQQHYTTRGTMAILYQQHYITRGTAPSNSHTISTTLHHSWYSAQQWLYYINNITPLLVQRPAMAILYQQHYTTPGTAPSNGYTISTTLHNSWLCNAHMI